MPIQYPSSPYLPSPRSPTTRRLTHIATEECTRCQVGTKAGKTHRARHALVHTPSRASFFSSRADWPKSRHAKAANVAGSLTPRDASCKLPQSWLPITGFLRSGECIRKRPCPQLACSPTTDRRDYLTPHRLILLDHAATTGYSRRRSWSLRRQKTCAMPSRQTMLQLLASGSAMVRPSLQLPAKTSTLFDRTLTQHVAPSLLYASQPSQR